MIAEFLKRLDRVLDMVERMVKVQEERVRLTEKMLDTQDQRSAEQAAAMASLGSKLGAIMGGPR